MENNEKNFETLLYEGYIRRFKEKRLFETDSKIPINLIKFYLDNQKEKVPKKVYDNFKTKYIYCENVTEGVNVTLSEVKSIVKNNIKGHIKEEVHGLADVYDYIQNYDFEKMYNFSIYTLMLIHRILYSHTPYPDAAGKFRTMNARISYSDVRLEEYTLISRRMADLFFEFKEILNIKDNTEEYIKRSIRLHATLIQIHPFSDGNGRSTRALMNLLFAYIKLPPVYVKIEEKQKYCKALEEAIVDNNSQKLEQFFMYKIVNAIIETNKDFSKEAINIL